jgi:hypothetical protein
MEVAKNNIKNKKSSIPGLFFAGSKTIKKNSFSKEF